VDTDKDLNVFKDLVGFQPVSSGCCPDHELSAAVESIGKDHRELGFNECLSW